ncbi:uncharacterized protein LOC109841518 [Asparagus officinalis]|uniref:uncharacterized protein LOC109841518 n=1 Tax=Asparagus officinalis TaxID=4686 RepID=UPI00098DE80A|nr:uncharacterized protein LOC109841518 [Asparagus officinalis]
MAEKDIICTVSSGYKAVFLKINSSTTILDLKFDVAERLGIPYESLILSYEDETAGSLKLPIENKGDMMSMVEHCHNLGLKEVHMKAFKEADDLQNIHCNERVQPCKEQVPQDIASRSLNSKSIDCGPPELSSTTVADKNPNDIPSRDNVMMIDDMISRSERIPAWWHTALTGEGQRFESVKELRLALLYYSMAKKFEYEFVKNEPKRQSRASRHFIATQLQPTLKVRPDIRPIDVQKEFLSSYGIRVEYSKIWWGKERAQERLYGDAYESYDQLRWYVDEVKKTNPGSYIHVEQDEGRPLIFLDGTFLKDRFKGILLSTVAYDGNQGIFPLAYCICDQENNVNWKWFLQGLWSILYERADPYNPPHKLVIISDADKGIREAVREFFPDSIHSRCVLHLVENFRTKLKDLGFKSKDSQILGNLLQSACYKYTRAEWNDYMDDIRLIDERAYNIVMNYAPENWANAFFPGVRYGHVTSNVAESFNKWIHEARLLRILQLIEHIRKQIMVRMNERRVMAESWNQVLCPKAEIALKENMDNGRPLEVRQSHTGLFEVQSHRSCQVDLDNKTCTCRGWDVTRVPCKHACASIMFMKRDVYQFYDWFMTADAFKRSYEPIIYPIPDYEKRSVPRDEIQILPPITTKRKGRNKTRRINNRTVYTRPVKCSRCHLEGHNRKTCNETIAD